MSDTIDQANIDIEDLRAELGAKNKQNADLQTQVNEYSGKLTISNFRRKLDRVAIKRGVPLRAMDDSQDRAENVWRPEDGVMMAFNPKAKNTKLLDRQGTPFTAETWLDDLEAKAPHLFEAEDDKGGESIRTVDRKDIGAHIEDIAAGRVQVRV